MTDCTVRDCPTPATRQLVVGVDLGIDRLDMADRRERQLAEVLAASGLTDLTLDLCDRHHADLAAVGPFSLGFDHTPLDR